MRFTWFMARWAAPPTLGIFAERSPAVRNFHRLSFSTDLREMDVIQGGEKKLAKALCQLIDLHQPKAVFVYSTCIVGVIGDDVEAVCRQVSAVKGIPVLPVHSEGFRGTKRDGYRAACEALLKLVGTGSTAGIGPVGVNILGDFNLAGEVWIIRDYFEKMGVEVVATITGDGRVDDIRRAHGAALNLVQCSGSMMHLAKQMQEKRGIPFKRVSYFGIEDMAQSALRYRGILRGTVARHRRKNRGVRARGAGGDHAADRAVPEQTGGPQAAVYVGGAFKAFSLVRALRQLACVR